MMVLVDSDILIEVSRGKDAAIIAKWIALSNSDVVVLYSPVSVAELWAEARPSEHDSVNNLFHALTCAPIDKESGHRAGLYLHQFRRSHAVEVADALIAASAIEHHAKLWTGNRKRYPMADISFFD